MNWKKLPTQPGKCEIKEAMDPIPNGPFAICPQHQMTKFEANPMSPDVKIDIVPKFELRFAHTTYAIGPAPTFETIKVGYWWDSSD